MEKFNTSLFDALKKNLDKEAFTPMPPGPPPNDPNAMAAAMPPMDPNAMMAGGGGAMPPMDPNMLMAALGGAGGAPVDPNVMAAAMPPEQVPAPDETSDKLATLENKINEMSEILNAIATNMGLVAPAGEEMPAPPSEDQEALAAMVPSPSAEPVPEKVANSSDYLKNLIFRLREKQNGL